MVGDPVSKSAVTELMRIAWRTVGAIITRVWADVGGAHDRFAGLTRIGIDEISYKRGHKYLTVVVDHDTGRLVWAAPGRDKATLGRSSTPSGRTIAPRSPMFPRTGPTGSPPWSPNGARTRCAAPTRSTSSSGPPTPSTRSAAQPGTTPARRPARDQTRPGPPARCTGPTGQARAPDEELPVRAVEEPGEPHRAAADQARLDRQDRPAAPPRLPAQGRPTADLQAALRRGRRRPRQLDRAGPAAAGSPRS